MTAKSKQRKVGFLQTGLHVGGVAMLLVGGVAYYALVLRPQTDARQQRLDEIDRLTELQHTAAGALDTERKLRSAIAQLQHSDAELHARIPEAASEHEFLHAFNELAREFGLHVYTYERGSDIEETTYSLLKVEVSCRGTYGAMCHLLERLRTMERIVVVEHLSVTSDMASGEHDFALSLALIYGLRSESPENREVHDA